MKNFEMKKYLINVDGKNIFQTYSKTVLIEYLNDIKSKKKYKDIIIYQTISKKECFNMLEKARKKFGSENVIVVDGDVFYIKSCDGTFFIGKKILNNLKLSYENFKIML